MPHVKRQIATNALAEKDQLKDRLKKASKVASEPLWTGPGGDGPNGGVTQSMIGSWLVCRERFRVQYVLGLQPPDDFNHRIEYGSMFHVCIEAHDKTPGLSWVNALADYTKGLCKTYPLQQDQIIHWMNVCKCQFPVYAEHWAKHKDKSGEVHTPLLQEQAFDVPYVLPSGRTVRLRGKWDGVELIKSKAGTGVWLDENKTKGDVDEDLLRRQLKFDLQTMWYLVALQEAKENQFNPKNVELRPLWGGLSAELKGVRYNVIRRPLSGGKGSIRKHQPTKSNPRGESDTEFYARLQGIIREEPGYWFMRWTSEVSSQDVERFKVQFLNPCLEQMCDWWEMIQEHPSDPFHPQALGRHFRLPYGIWNPIADGRPTEYDAYLDEGSISGLRRVESLFKELA